MPQISIRVDGNVKVGAGMKALGNAIEDISDDELQAGLEAATQEARGGWPAGGHTGYTVAPPPNSGYERTGNLGRSTTWEIYGRSYRIQSNAISQRGRAYSKYVIGDGRGEGQAKIHLGRWPVMYQVALKWAEKLINKIDNRIRRKAAEEGIGL